MPYVVDFCILPERTPINSRGANIVQFEMSYIRDVLLFCSSRLHNRGGDAIGRYDIYVKTVILILLGCFTNKLSCVGFFPSQSYCLDIFPEVYTRIEIERYGIWDFAVLPGQPWRMQFGVAVLPGNWW